jgi:DNA-binding transcriptional regulator YhcF (GntR family)
VKNRQLVKIEAPYGSEALSILRSVPGIEVVTLEQPIGDARADAMIHSAGTTHSIVIEFKRHANTATAHQLAAWAGHLRPDTALVLVAETTTSEARRLLADNGIGVIDGLGNVHVELPGLLLHLEPRHDRPAQKAGPASPARLTGKAGLVAQALLLDPQRRWTVMDLAERTAVSTGLTHRVLTRLEREGIVTAQGAGPHRTRQVQNPTALLDLWAEEAKDRRVQRLQAFRLSRDPNNLVEPVSNALTQAGIDHAMTGPVVAQRLAPFITSVPVADIWITQHVQLTTAASATGAEPVETGHNLVFAQADADAPLAFRTERDGLSVANRFRLYLDLLRNPRRGREQAARLREEVIGF